MANDHITYNTAGYDFTVPSHETTTIGYLGPTPGTVEVCYLDGRRDIYHVTSYSVGKRVACLIDDDYRVIHIMLRNCRSITYTPDKTEE